MSARIRVAAHWASRLLNSIGRFLPATGIAAAGLMMPLGASAQVEFLYGAPIPKGDSPPAPAPPILLPKPPGDPYWLQVLINEGDIAGEVVMTMNAFFQEQAVSPDTTPTVFPDPFVSQVAFNFIDTLNIPIDAAGVSYVSGSCSSIEAAICENFTGMSENGVFGQNNLMGVSGGAQTSGYDLLINLPPPKGSAKNVLNGGNTITFKLFGSGLSPAAFLGRSETSGQYYSVAKVQGLCPDDLESDSDECSTVISGEPNEEPPTPKEDQVPAPLPLLGACAAWTFSRRLRRRATRL